MAIGGRVTITGVDRVIRNIKASDARLQKAAVDSLTEAAKDILAEAQENTPHDTGNLKGYVSPSGEYPESVRQTPEGLSQRIAFHATYAVYVHEINKNYKRGGWKFLANAMNMWQGLALRLFEKRLRKML